MVGTGPSAELTDEDWSDLTDMHVLGTLRCVRAAFPALEQSRAAAVVNLSSMNARLGVSGRLSLLRREGRRRGDDAGAGGRVGAARHPGERRRPRAMSTPQMLRGCSSSGEHDDARLLARVPLDRLGRADEIAAVIAFLASSEPHYLTGQTIVVDGGRLVNGDL